ncbi:MAG: hypothetical protein U0R24_00875 [Solirubrobacterales bacterium]
MVSTSASNAARLDCAAAFALSEEFNRNALRLSSRELLHNDLALLRGEVQPSEPIEFVRDEGSDARDWVGTTYATLQLVSPKFLRLLDEHGFTGWTTFPVELALDISQALEGYRGLAITGRCGRIEEEMSERITLPPPVPQGHSRPGLRGLCFEPDSWDGSDLFMPEDSAWVLATEQVIGALKYAGIVGVVYRRRSEIELPVLGGK